MATSAITVTMPRSRRPRSLRFGRLSLFSKKPIAPAGQHDRMGHPGEDRRHVAERGVDREAHEQQQHPVVHIRQDYRDGHRPEHRAVTVNRRAAAINRQEDLE